MVSVCGCRESGFDSRPGQFILQNQVLATFSPPAWAKFGLNWPQNRARSGQTEQRTRQSPAARSPVYAPRCHTYLEFCALSYGQVGWRSIGRFCLHSTLASYSCAADFLKSDMGLRLAQAYAATD